MLILKSDICVFFFFLKERGKVTWNIFKNEIENRKKLKLNGTFEFIDYDKNCDK